ncbi:MAG TPA: acyltransferase family protein [Rhodoferax sp.]|jgi:glucan biosynthesis protein C|nr:acyltransferase family protein [Rhodoferax sp.]
MLDREIGTSERLYFLDWLRIAAFGLLVAYHVGMYYVSWPFHVKSPFASAVLEPWMKMSSPWRMSLLFLISGAVTSLLLLQKPDGFMRSRSRRLLLPLLCGVVLIVPPQSYFEVVEKFAFDGSYFDFLRLYFGHYKGFCANDKCLILPTWNHLWFLPYLWTYTFLLWLLLRGWPDLLDYLAGLAAKLLPGARLLWMPMLWILLIRWTLFKHFPETHDLVHDWFWHTLYLSVFLAGAVFARTPGLWARAAYWRWHALTIAMLAWAVFATDAVHGLGYGQRGVVALQQWGALVAVLGFGYAHLNRDHPWRAYLTDAVFPVYILHQTLIIVISQAIKPLEWQPLLEGPVLVFSTLGLSLLAFELVRQIGFARPFFGLNKPVEI